jgi:anti-sigma B factor antagonist
VADIRFFLRGEIDFASAPSLSRDLAVAVNADANADLLVDCSQLTFIDSAGIYALLEAHRALRADERHMLVVNVPLLARRVFEILGLTDMLRIEQLSN